MEDWEGWETGRLVLVMTAVLFAGIWVQLSLMHWAGAFKRWQMWVPVFVTRSWWRARSSESSRARLRGAGSFCCSLGEPSSTVSSGSSFICRGSTTRWAASAPCVTCSSGRARIRTQAGPPGEGVSNASEKWGGVSSPAILTAYTDVLTGSPAPIFRTRVTGSGAGVSLLPVTVPEVVIEESEVDHR